MTDTTLGKYRILAEIGKGGFATVYRALDTTLDREVALKVLDPLLARDPAWVARFQREAKAIARLKHPHIVTIHKIGESEGRLYIAMELIDGPSLAQRIAARGRLPWDETLAILEQVADALDTAHGQGVLHRDLKPGNILLDPKRVAILTDFGFARLVGESSMSVSMSGGVVGTPAYIAPEVWDGEEPTSQTDLYSLGCVAYEMLTGEVLFAGKTPSVVMRKHLMDGPQLPAQWPDGTPDGVRAVLAHALTKAAAERYASASEFMAALAAASQTVQAPVGEVAPPDPLQDSTAPEPIPTPTPAAAHALPRWLWLAVGVGGAALLVALVFLFWLPKPSTPTVSIPVTLTHAQPTATIAQPPATVAPSPTPIGRSSPAQAPTSTLRSVPATAQRLLPAPRITQLGDLENADSQVTVCWEWPYDLQTSDWFVVRAWSNIHTKNTCAAIKVGASLGPCSVRVDVTRFDGDPNLGGKELFRISEESACRY